MFTPAELDAEAEKLVNALEEKLDDGSGMDEVRAAMEKVKAVRKKLDAVYAEAQAAEAAARAARRARGERVEDDVVDSKVVDDLKPTEA